MTAGPMFAPGDPVEITAGMSKGCRGRVVGITRHRFGDEAVYAVKLETGYTRDIRESFLRELVVPVATASDDDVMGSALRRVTSGGF